MATFAQQLSIHSAETIAAASRIECIEFELKYGAPDDAHWGFWLIILDGFSFGHNFLPSNIQKPTDTVIESP